MSIEDQFEGLDMKSIISGPLQAAADGQEGLAESAIKFFSEVGLPSTEVTQPTDEQPPED